jgi:DivIVA domain-containing protein
VARASRYGVVAVSTSESFAAQRPPEVLRAVDDREFAVVPMGYDTEQVDAYLGEVEASFRHLERWAEEAKARLKVASGVSEGTHVRTDRPSTAQVSLIGTRRDPHLRITARPRLQPPASR